MKRLRILAAVLAATCLSAFCPVSTQAAKSEDLPEWVPSGYLDAVNFRNQYGATRIGDGYVCLVFVESEEDPNEEIPRYKLVTTEGVLEEVSHEILTAPPDLMGGTQYEVAVYKPKAAGEFEAALVDTWAKSGGLDLGYQHAAAYYSFAVDEALQVTETDWFAWVPDCLVEYKAYTDEFGQVSRHGNNAVICLKASVGTAYGWEPEFDHSAVQYAVVSECNQERTTMVAGGSSYTVYVLQALKDGPVDITYHYMNLYGDPDIVDTVEAHFYAFDDGQTLLSPGDTRVEVLDADTGERIPETIMKDNYLGISTDIGYLNPDTGEWMYTGPIYVLENNPEILNNFGKWFKADKFSFGLGPQPLPGYSLPEDYKTVKELGNDMYNITFRLKADAAYSPGGDFNQDGSFTVTDVIALQKWLLGVPGTNDGDGKAADFY
ncbi:MAG: hypothetical protein IKN55_02780, partial [Oscillospiraceae bacterium]|nr:hypothetical protein [Oscillospiraceae bacterium]